MKSTIILNLTTESQGAGRINRAIGGEAQIQDIAATFVAAKVVSDEPDTFEREFWKCIRSQEKEIRDAVRDYLSAFDDRLRVEHSKLSSEPMKPKESGSSGADTHGSSPQFPQNR